MNKDIDELGQKLGRTLDTSTDLLDGRIRKRLFEARQGALNHLLKSHSGSGSKESSVLAAIYPHLRMIFAILALLIGAGGTYYWNQLTETYDNEELDSALLSDELPPEAYLDRGFQAWLDRASHSHSQ